MDNCKESQQAYDDVKEIVEMIRSLHRSAALQYSILVDDVISGRVADEKSIERIMDGLVGFCDSPECLGLFKKLCRHILHKYPQMVKDYIECYRMLYEEQTEGEPQ